jgi:hypothetical protein
MIGLFFWGMALIALGAYARVNLHEIAYIKQVGDLMAICGIGVIGYAFVLVAMAKSAYR